MEHIETARLSAEAIGLARDFRRRVEAEDATYLATIHTLFEPIRERETKHPHRKVRPEMLAELVRRWRIEPPRQFRLSFDASLHHGAKGKISERRVCIIKQAADDALDRAESEPGVAVCGVSLIAHADGTHRINSILATFSLPALASRYQRGVGIDDPMIMLDLALAAVPPDHLPPGGGIKIATDGHGGGWHGRVVMVRCDDGTDRRIIAARTWLSGEMIPQLDYDRRRE